MTYSIKTTIYGARGSIPNASGKMAGYGGETTCLAVETRDNPLIIIDAGTGIVNLGRELRLSEKRKNEIHLFFTHTHWDHILGLPYFPPMLENNWILHFYTLGKPSLDIKHIFSSLFDPLYFPIPYEKLNPNIYFHKLNYYDRMEIGNATVDCCRVNHPGYALGYRISCNGKSIFFASDSAPFRDILFQDKFAERKRTENEKTILEMKSYDAKMRELIKNSDMLFFDANFTDDEYERLFNYGHSSMMQTYDLAKNCGIKHVVFWHHDRSRVDKDIDKLTKEYVIMGRKDGIIVEPARIYKSYIL